MKNKISIILTLLVLIFIIGGCKQGETATTTTMPATPTTLYAGPTVTIPVRPNVVERDIEISNFKFTPDTIEVNAGEMVLLTLYGREGQHTFTLEDFNIDMQMPEGRVDTIQLIADKVGTFEFYCRYHSNMRGQLIVRQS